MADEKQLEILKQGVEVWNKWRKVYPLGIDLREADLEGADLIGADLGGANLSGANLLGVKLREANLVGAILRKADLVVANLLGGNLASADLREAVLAEAVLMQANLKFANLNKANLTYANLNEANLSEANLGEANLSSAYLHEANLNSASLKGTDLSGASLFKTHFGNNDISGSINLGLVEHRGPSFVDTFTIQKSKGKIPLEFLRGCGLNDLDIEYAKLAAPGLDPDQVTQITYEIHHLYCDQPIQFYSCFISYNNKDHNFAQRLHDDLQDNGVRCWFAPEDMKTGDQIRPTIDREIRLRDKLLVILSENSVKSEWVGDEVEAALEEESKSERLVLFPVRLDDAVMRTRDDWAAKIKRRRHIRDFSNWQDESSYRQAFARLLRDLKAPGALTG
jgi:uncharacterized protein YjbI with pentapeptide repeats